MQLGLTRRQLSLGLCSPSYLKKLELDQIHKPDNEMLESLFSRLKINQHTPYPEDADASLENILKYWYQLIYQRKLEEAEDYYKVLKEDQPDPSSQKLCQFYEIIHFYYDLMTENHSSAEHLYKRLSLKQESFSNQHRQLFFKCAGIYHIQKNQYNEGISYLNRSLQLNIQEDPEVYYYISIIYSRLGQHELSIQHAQKALHGYQRIMNQRRMLETNLVIALGYILLKEYHQAEIYLQNILNVQLSHPIEYLRGMTYHNLGYIRYLQKKYDLALFYLKEAEKYKTQDYDKLTTWYVMAKIYFLKKDYRSAIPVISQGKRIAKKYHDKKYRYKLFVLEQQIKNNIMNAHMVTAFENIILPYFKNNGETDEYEECMQILGDIYKKNKISSPGLQNISNQADANS